MVPLGAVVLGFSPKQMERNGKNLIAKSADITKEIISVNACIETDNNYHSDIIVNNIRFINCYKDYRTGKIYIQYQKSGLYYVRNIYSGKEVNGIYKFSLDWGENFTYYDKEEHSNVWLYKSDLD